ncbi:MAG TPA: PatA/PatG family cyanobactin maturation protease [Nostocaceae cyanobacterium]|nr:PatA/PatG family cyanobactin maturation protease [Nostocaceae cyanobacterium]
MAFEIPDITTKTGGFTDISTLTGLKSLWAESLGDPRVCIAVLDGPVDESHPCFENANITRLPSLVSDNAGSGSMSGHGTHITSVIFGQHSSSSPVQGIAPNCRGLVIPVFSDHRRDSLSQIDLARAINQAVEQGANVINISGGQKSFSGEADPILTKAIQFCHENNVLVVAAAGNNACSCIHVPAALPAVLAVGAMNAQGLPLDFSNWGNAYQTQGILAPGDKILGAAPGGGTAIKSGTSFATPVVSGIVGLLLSIQLKQAGKLDPHAIRAAILKSATPCNPQVVEDCRRFLVGSLDILGAYALIAQGGKKPVSDESLEETILESNQTPYIGEATVQANEIDLAPEAIPSLASDIEPSAALTSQVQITNTHQGMTMNTAPSSVVPSGNCGCNTGVSVSGVTPSNAPISLVYALGTVGYDFATEARRDSFKQLMPMVWSDTGEEVENPSVPPRPGIFAVPANPYDARQMARYLQGDNISEAASLIWTLNLELTPIYAIEPQAPFASTVYASLRDFLSGQVLDENNKKYVERVSIPAVLTGKTVTLFSGQVVPVIQPLNTRGMYGWKVNELIDAVMQAIHDQTPPPDLTPEREEEIKYSLRNFLMRIYYDLRNLGQTSQERAQNYAATNVFQYADSLVKVLSNQSRSWASAGNSQGVTMQLDSFEVERSPFCRKDSDCWDVKIKFFDPENDRRAKRVLRFTIDVSDIMPVTLGTPRLWDVAH